MNNLFNSIIILFLALYWLGAFFIVYHLITYGITSWPKKISIVFITGSIVLSILSFMLFIQIDWQKIFGNQVFNQNSQTALTK